MALIRALQIVLRAFLVLQGMGPAFEIEVSQKAKVCLLIENVNPLLQSHSLNARSTRQA